MRILQVSNILSHHQLPLASQIAKMVGEENFRFAATQPLSKERERLGWKTHTEEPWILRAGERPGDLSLLEKWWDDADVVICGERRFKRMEDRHCQGKLTFYMSERWWKPPIGLARLLHPSFALMTAHLSRVAGLTSIHYLPMGFFAAADMRRIATFRGRMWQWGYLTDMPNPIPSCAKNHNGLRVLWAGRMLSWKSVDTLILAFARFFNDHQNATLTIVGDGPERSRLEKLAGKYLIPSSYQFLPPVPAPRMVELMSQHHVYVLPSNGYEGWGAVVNEAMSAGCAVIASSVAGSAKTLIKHRENGLLFPSGNWKKLSDYLNLLGRDEIKRRQIAEAGQVMVYKSWSPSVAAERFLMQSEAILMKHPAPIFDHGLMAPAWKGRL